MQVIPVTASTRLGKPPAAIHGGRRRLGVLGLPRHRLRTWLHSRASIIISVHTIAVLFAEFGVISHAWLGPKPGWWPGFCRFSPALLIPPFPAASVSRAITIAAPTTRRSGQILRRARWASRKVFFGENSFPLILQNIIATFSTPRLCSFPALIRRLAAMWFDIRDRREGIRIGVAPSCCSST